MSRNAASTSFSEAPALAAMQSRHIGRSRMSTAIIAVVSGMIPGFLSPSLALRADELKRSGPKAARRQAHTPCYRRLCAGADQLCRMRASEGGLAG
jgi:hypothetical protein